MGEESKKLWGGRFSGKTDPVMEEFNASINIDKRMWEEDIAGSIAYAKGLEKIQIISNDEKETLIEGLNKVATEWKDNKFVIQPSDEDIHTANERRLKELIGSVAGKLHTGRSRNDQVATDTRLWLRKQIQVIKDLLLSLIQVFVERSESEIDVIMPGYTHLQRAQPICWSQWLLSHCWALKEDLERLDGLFSRVNSLPLGCGAIAGNPFGIDRQFLAEELGFSSVIQNSLYGTKSRDFVAEFLFWSSLLMNHLSQWSEDLIIYSSKEFGFVTISDAYSTGSSLMPQKKNPDSLELIRGKSGRLFGNFSGFMMTLKGLPSTYNKDLQEDKEALFDTVDSLKGIIQVATGTLGTLTLNADKCLAALSPEMLSTDVAYYLVRKGMPFREAHAVAGSVVQLAEQKKIEVSELSLDDMKSINNLFYVDYKDIWNYDVSVNQYTSIGGTSKNVILSQIESLKKFLK
ncbi:argininosuccinate lyase-like [Clytia hemisphaerica]|uniref:Argininosuccinate lyase n=1 Tax=Clytia hemisphaerica TaxID=252671 RepID=A0A7M6DS15_9CNID|eukprot:TCONS_00000659-protein